MENLCDQIKQMAVGVSHKERHQILAAIQDVYQDIESPENARTRIRSRSLDCCVVAASDELNIFGILVEAGGPLSIDEVAEKSNASPGFVPYDDVSPDEGRILCFLATRYYICEVGEDRFVANRITQTLALDEFSADIQQNVTVNSPTYLATPPFLKKNGYRDNTNLWHCPFQMGRQTDKAMHEWAQEHPELANHYNRYMQSHHKMLRPFTDVYPIEDLLDDMDSDEQPFFVDVAGGYGQQALAIKVAYPYARVILEELPAQIEGFDVGEDIEMVPQNYFEEQKVKGSRIYYLRHNLHACPDATCITILRNLADAMSEKSVILIDDAVMPPTGATYHATLYDMAMICLFGSKERTQAQWEQLLAEADRGLKITRIAQYSEEFNYAVIEVVKRP